MDQVILVNEQDEQVGVMEKLQAHVEGQLHRAISVFIFNSKDELLIHQRAFGKYHSSGLWSNTCCSHPMPGETTEAAAKRRLQEEMGMQCELSKSFSFIYKAHLDHELTEFEFDHVYKGRSDAEPMQNNEEVAAWKYISVADLQTDIQLHPEKYTEWFKICIKDYIDNLIS
jgi:isopentenyl-diphosphate delta-isomerase